MFPACASTEYGGGRPAAGAISAIDYSTGLNGAPRTDGCGAALLRYRYDSGDNRIIKSSKDVVFANVERHTVYVFDSLELRRTAYGTPVANEYVRNEMTEVPYLFAHGVRLARVVYDNTVPASDPTAQHVFFELGDHLGSASTVLDMATGELVEKATFSAYGSTESDYRPDRWGAFREDHRFTGKEEDIEVGLVYFGKRFYSANLNRWMSPDPLAVHDVGEADLNVYAYVEGRALYATDPLGLAYAAPPSMGDRLLSNAIEHYYSRAAEQWMKGGFENKASAVGNAMGGAILDAGPTIVGYLSMFTGGGGPMMVRSPRTPTAVPAAPKLPTPKAPPAARPTPKPAPKAAAPKPAPKPAAKKTQAAPSPAQAPTRVTGDALKKARKEFEAAKPGRWKHEAATNEQGYSPEQLADMRQGKAPIGSDQNRMELHHETPLAEGGSNAYENLKPLTRTDHRLGENYKKNHPNLP